MSLHDEGLYTCFARNLSQATQTVDPIKRVVAAATPAGLADIKRKKAKKTRRPSQFVELFSMQLMMAMSPSVEHKLETWDLIAGSSLFLQVIVTGAPKPHCHWRFNGQNLAAGNFFGASVHFRDSSGGRNSVLEVVSLAEDHSGTYTCVCENAVGSVRWEEALVTVRPKSSAGKYGGV